jgi:hypothetical protein
MAGERYNDSCAYSVSHTGKENFGVAPVLL